MLLQFSLHCFLTVIFSASLMKQIIHITKEIREEIVLDREQRTMRRSRRASSIQSDQPDHPREESVETKDGSHADFKEKLQYKANCLIG